MSQGRKHNCYWQVKTDNILFIVKGTLARERFDDIRHNSPNKVFHRTNAQWVAYKFLHAPYQKIIEL